MQDLVFIVLKRPVGNRSVWAGCEMNVTFVLTHVKFIGLLLFFRRKKKKSKELAIGWDFSSVGIPVSAGG